MHLAMLAMSGCAPLPEPGEPPAALRVEVGEDAGRGNVVGIQAWMAPGDYATAERFDARLRGWLDEADAEGLLRPDTVVVLPEYVGTWLVAVDARHRAYTDETTGRAMKRVAWANLFAFLGAKGDAPAEDADTYAVFAVRADEMAADYQAVMGGLAGDYGVTLVGGSILLPDPELVDGVITPTRGAPLFNVSFVFGADGAVLGRVRKAFPTADEQPFVTPAPVTELPTFETPAGRLGVLICADAWFPESYAALGEVDVVVVPQFTSGDGAWTVPWGGYSGWEAPDDVDPDDVGALTEGEAWRAYSLPGRAPTGLTVPLRGALWDLGDDGQSLIVREGVLAEGPLDDAPALLSLWLP